MTDSPDLFDLTRRHARGGAALPAAATLRGLGDAWKSTEQRLVAAIAAAPKTHARTVGAFAALARRCGEKEARGRAARLAGSADALAGRYADSLAPYRRAIELLRGAARDGARLGLASSLLRLARFDEARDLCRAIRVAARRRGDAGLAAAALMNQAVAVHEGGDHAAAETLYAKAADELDAAGAVGFAASARQNRANALSILDRYDEASALYEAASATFAALGLTRESAQCRYNRGVLLGLTDRLGEADETLEDAERALRELGDLHDAALARIDRGEALYRARLLPEAERAVKTARRELPRRGMPHERTRALLLHARILIAQGDAKGALALLRRRLPQESRSARAERTELRGHALAESGRFARAANALVDAARGFGRRRPAGRARALTAAAWCALRDGDRARAARLARSAESLSCALGVPSLRYGSAAVSFVIASMGRRRDVADAALTRTLSAVEDVRSGLGNDPMRAALLRGGDAWFAPAVRHVLAGEDGERRALELLERWRAGALRDLLASADRTHTLGSADDPVARLRAHVARLEHRLESETRPAFLRSAVATAELELAEELAEAEQALARAVRPVATSAGAATLDTVRLARRAPRGTLVLSLFGDAPGPYAGASTSDAAGGVAFALSRGGGVRAVGGLAPPNQIAHLVADLRFRVGRFALGPAFVERHRGRLARETAAVLAKLSDAILGPLAAEIRAAERLIIVPSGPWSQVPFAALPFDGLPLAEHASVSLVPALAMLSSRVRAARGRPVVVSAADDRAPDIRVEAERVASALPNARVLEDDKATCAALGALRSPRYLHIAAHGRFRADAPGMSGVRLADGWLRAVEFPRLSLRGSLVVLSGCETGLTPLGARAGLSGGEVEGLVRGVLAGGASDLIVSLWHVGDSETARLMERFYALHLSGLPVEQALAQTQAELARKGRHPWEWAGFTLWSRRLKRG